MGSDCTEGHTKHST